MKFSICRRPCSAGGRAATHGNGQIQNRFGRHDGADLRRCRLKLDSLPETVTDSVVAPRSSVKSTVVTVAVLTSTDSRTAVLKARLRHG